MIIGRFVVSMKIFELMQLKIVIVNNNYDNK